MTYHIPEKDKWEFDASVTDIFEEMLSRSIPQYPEMRNCVVRLTSHYAVPGGYIIDLGCSRGEMIAQLLSAIGAGNHYVGCDISEPMLKAARERFVNYQQGIVKIVHCDLRKDFPQTPSPANVVLAVLTLQFVPIEYRQQLISRVYGSLKPGGAFIVVEKVLGASAHIDDLMVTQYYDLKSRNGYSNYEISRKRLSLEGVLVPMKAEWNTSSLKDAGFSQVDCFWRWMNFAGFLAVK